MPITNRRTRWSARAGIVSGVRLGAVTSPSLRELIYGFAAPMMVTKPARVKDAFGWAKSRDRWHRRAACVALIRGTRAKMFFQEIMELSDMLLADSDDMVQKGLGWLLRETAKFDAKRTVPYLMRIRERAPRLVLRTACETLPASATRAVLGPGGRTRG